MDARELTRDEKKKIRSLVTGMCANYDRESGLCLPLDLSLIHISLFGLWLQSFLIQLTMIALNIVIFVIGFL